MTPRSRIGLALGLLAGACGDPDTSTPTTEPVVVALAPCGFADTPSGTIDVGQDLDVFHPDPTWTVGAVLSEGPAPALHEVVEEAGGCRYLHYAAPFCDPACAGGEICAADATCAAFPATVGGGTLTLRTSAGTLALEPYDFSPGTYPAPADVPDALFAVGDPIGANLAGGELPALSFGAEGVEGIDRTLVDEGYTMADGADAVFTWTPGPDPGACVSLVLNGFNVSHGGPLQDLVLCEGTDTGSMTVPRSMVERFPVGETPELTEGFDWPHSTLTRSTRARADTPAGPVELRVRSTAHFLLGHSAP